MSFIILPKVTRKGLAILLICFIFSVITHLAGRIVQAYYNGDPHGVRFLPSHAEIPLVLAPFLTLCVSASIFWEYWKNDWGSKWAHGISMIVVYLCIHFFAYIPGWKAHMAVLTVLFACFNIWDYYMLKDPGITGHARQEVENGSRFINKPTLYGIIIIYTFLGMGRLMHSLTIEPLYLGEWLPHATASNKMLANPGEMFTIGFITFHLIIAALSYRKISSPENA